MIERRRTVPAAYDEPFLWWGPIWQTPPVLTIVELIRDGTMSASTAGLLWALVARRASLIVAAGPRGAGKTTVLTALLDFLPARIRRIYLRGCYESFAFLDDGAVVPSESMLLINEISAHLPAYLWGPGVRRALAATRRGFRLAATAHAATVEELVGQLAGYPLRVPIADLAAISTVVILNSAAETERPRSRVAGVWSLAPSADRGIRLGLLADAEHVFLDHSEASGAQSGMTLPAPAEVTSRAEFLSRLVAETTSPDPRRIRRAIARFVPD